MKAIVRVILVLVLTASGYYSYSQAFAQWRGIERKGIFVENDLLTSWPEGGPAQRWQADSIGNGYGSPSITEDRIYVMGEKDSIGYLFAFDHKGKLQWRSDYGKEWVKTFPGSRSTPTVTEDLIYTCSGLGNLACFELKTGTRKWFVDMVKDLHGRFTYHGHSESPLIYNDLVYLVPGGIDTNVVAFNRFSGKIVWICKGKGESPAYNSPILITLPSRTLLVTFTAYAMLGIDAKTGELLWTHEQVNIPVEERKSGNGDTHSNSAWYEDGFIYYFEGDGNGAVKLKLSEDGKEVTQLWRNDVIDNYMGGFIKLGDYLYSCYFSRKDFRVFDANTGQALDSLKIGRGSVIYADNLLYYYSIPGDVYLIRPNKNKPEIVSTFKITVGTKEHFSHPVIHKGVMYIRHGQVLLAYDIRRKK